MTELFSTTQFKFKILVLFLFLMSALAGFYLVLQDKPLFNTTSSKPQETPRSTFSVFADKLTPLVYEPIRLYSETIDLDAKLISVGILESGIMETPKNWNEAGWYERSSKVGGKGNIVINGHYDDDRGQPAAFYRLKNLKIGDKVFVSDELGRKYAYSVEESFFLDINDPSRLSVLSGAEDSHELTLITCGGVWNSKLGTYNERLVVKARLL
jgi:sortase A